MRYLIYYCYEMFKVNGGFLLGLFDFDNPTPIKSSGNTWLHFVTL